MIILTFIWLLAPAGIANMAAPFAALVFPKWDWPVDFGLKYKGLRILGSHKTIRGFFFGCIAGFTIFGLQQVFFHEFSFFRGLELFDYSTVPFYSGLLLGLGGLIGDSIKSFFKRRAGVKPGDSWFPWDQIDWITATAIIWKLLANISYWQMGWLILLGLGISLVAKVIGFMIKVDEKKF